MLSRRQFMKVSRGTVQASVMIGWEPLALWWFREEA